MVTQKGANTFVVGIHGNFDDAQTGVKKIFSDKELQDIIAILGMEELSDEDKVTVYLSLIHIYFAIAGVLYPASATSV